MKTMMKLLLPLTLACVLPCALPCAAQNAAATAPTGEIPAAEEQAIRSAIANLKAAQIAALKAEQAMNAANEQIGNEIALVKARLELDQTWDFNPSYNDAKSADFHALKFVKRADAAQHAQFPATSQTPAPAAQSSQVGPKQ